MKYLADTHMHSIYSYDGQMRIEDIIKRARELHLLYITITEHLELSSISYKQFLNRYKLYSEDIDKYQEKYKDITILKGVEVGNPNKYMDELEKLQDLDIDYIIGSNHELNVDILTYYKECLEIANTNLIDSLGHVDYIKRRNNDECPLEAFDAIFEALKNNNETLEVNSSAYRRLFIPSFPSTDILNHYLNHYSDRITMGSDAHRLNEIYSNIENLDNSIEANKGIYIKRKFISLTNKK